LSTNDNDVEVVIITALQKEADAVVSHFKNVTQEFRKHRSFYRCEIEIDSWTKPINIIVLPQDKMGNVEAAAATSQAINAWNPQYLLLIGIAGGIKSEGRHLGDIVVSEQIVNYELGKVKDKEFENRWDVIKGSPLLLNIANKISYDDWVSRVLVPRPDGKVNLPKVHIGVVGSGDKVIANEEFAKFVSSKWSKMAAIEMESYGVGYAAYKAETSPHFLMVKSLCDWADSSKNDSWQEYCSDVAASYAISLIKKIPFFKGPRTQAQKKADGPFSHKSKIGLCGRLDDDWEDLADYFDIPIKHRRKFRPGRECQDIWKWLLQRGKLDLLPDGLEGIDRDDLLDELIPN